jgi:UDP-glucose 4-epimerase
LTSLVTGGAGFIGSHVAEELSRSGEKVVVLDDLSGGFRENVAGENVVFVKGSINDAALVADLFATYSFATIYHLAAYAAEGLSHFIKHFNYENNLIGSVNLINSAVNFGVKTFIFTSSIAVYGANQPPLTEDMTPHPEDSYGIAKYSVEQELRITHEMFGLDYIIFRPHNVYGERQNIGDKYRNVIGIFMNQILKGEPMTIFGDGNQTRAFTYISDVAPIIADSFRNPEALNKVFNIGSDHPYSLNFLAEAVARAIGVQPRVRHLQERNEVKHAYASHTQLEKVFSPSAPMPIEQGLERMAGWVKSIGARNSQKFENIEISKNLPPSWV